MPHEAAFAKLSTTLRSALTAETLESSRLLIADAIERTDKLAHAISTAAVKRGRKGGNKTAERGPEYFKQIAAMRKTKGGGRPRKAVQNPIE